MQGSWDVFLGFLPKDRECGHEAISTGVALHARPRSEVVCEAWQSEVAPTRPPSLRCAPLRRPPSPFGGGIRAARVHRQDNPRGGGCEREVKLVPLSLLHPSPNRGEWPPKRSEGGRVGGQ